MIFIWIYKTDFENIFGCSFKKFHALSNELRIKTVEGVEVFEKWSFYNKGILLDFLNRLNFRFQIQTFYEKSMCSIQLFTLFLVMHFLFLESAFLALNFESF